jgi:hypothetical protein
MSYKDLTPQQVAEIIAAYKDGEPVHRIKLRYELNSHNFYTLLDKNQVYERRTIASKVKLPSATVEQVISKYKAGSKAGDILKEFGFGTTVLYNILDENKVPRRVQRTEKHNRL